SFKEMLDIQLRRMRRGAGQYRGQIDGEKSAGAEKLRQAEYRKPAGEREDGRERRFEPQALQRLRQQPAPCQTEHRTARHLFEEEQRGAANADRVWRGDDVQEQKG